jgi:hypothetical protein
VAGDIQNCVISFINSTLKGLKDFVLIFVAPKLGKRTVIASRDYWAAKQVVILKNSTDPRPQECFQKLYYTKSVDEFQDPRPKYLVNINPISIDLYFETRPQTPVASNNKYNFN